MKHEIIVDTPENVRRILQKEWDETQRANDEENVDASGKLAKQYIKFCDDLTWRGAFLRHFYLQRMNIRSGKPSNGNFSVIIRRDDKAAQALQEHGWELNSILGTDYMVVSN